MLPLLRAAVDDVVALVELREQPRNLLGRVLEIVVDGDDRSPTRGTDSGKERVVLAVVPCEIETPHPPICPGCLHDPVPTPVGAAVVHENELEVCGLRVPPRRAP